MDQAKFMTMLVENILSCTRCQNMLKPPVPPEGVFNSRIVLVGRNPGVTEWKEGRPFVGLGGMLLNSELSRIGISRSRIFICNLCCCYASASDRPPVQEEINACSRFLKAIVIMKPDSLYVTLGKHATEFFLGSVGRFADVKGQPYHVKSATIFPCTHPGQALRSSAAKLAMHQDFNLLKNYVSEFYPDYISVE